MLVLTVPSSFVLPVLLGSRLGIYHWMVAPSCVADSVTSVALQYSYSPFTVGFAGTGLMVTVMGFNALRQPV